MFNKDIFSFLSQLAKNNNREWYAKNKATYKKLRDEFKDEVEEIALNISQFDENLRVNPMNMKDYVKIFRIFRDVRFSKNKVPYKTNFGAAIGYRRTEDISPFYYIHIEPGNCFLAGGVYMPSAVNLKKIRNKIDVKYKNLNKIINDSSFKAIFPNGFNRYSELKTYPRGFSKDHPALEHLKLKSFTVGVNYQDKEMSSKNLTEEIETVFKQIKRINDFLRA